jgi:hypothetical protein
VEVDHLVETVVPMALAALRFRPWPVAGSNHVRLAPAQRLGTEANLRHRPGVAQHLPAQLALASREKEHQHQHRNLLLLISARQFLQRPRQSGRTERMKELINHYPCWRFGIGSQSVFLSSRPSFLKKSDSIFFLSRRAFVLMSPSQSFD